MKTNILTLPIHLFQLRHDENTNADCGHEGRQEEEQLEEDAKR